MTADSELNMWQAIDAYLASIGHQLDKDFNIRKLSGGSANYNYLISMDGEKAVLRRPPDGPLPPGANDIAREYKVLSSLGDAFPAAPKGLLFCNDEAVIGVPFCVSQFREGICIGRHLPDELVYRPQIGAALSAVQVETLAQLHRVEVESVGLTDLGRADGFLERQVGGWFKRGQRVLGERQQEHLSAIRDWLAANLPEQRASALVHNDFKLDNMLIDPDSLEVKGVVDWDMCTIGDPFYELAILLAYWGGKNDHNLYRFQCRMPCEAEGWWTRREVMKHYLELTRSTLNEHDLSFYWWLTQYRSIIVYAQLQALFQRSGERPAALTEEDSDMLPIFVNDLLAFALANLGSLPADLI